MSSKKKVTNYFVCPHCRKRQTKVGVESKCTQTLNLETEEYTDLSVGETLSMFCLNCGKEA